MDEDQMSRRRKVECHMGHVMAGENLYVSPRGARECRTCKRRRMIAYRAARSSGVGKGGVNAAKTHCPRGHEYSSDNTYIQPNGARTCRVCRGVADRKSKLRRREMMCGS